MLLRAVQSVKDQHMTDYEHIVIDDGSPIDILKKIKHDRLKYIWKPHTGVLETTYTLNSMLVAAVGEYCIMLGSDDYFIPDMLPVLVRYLDDNPDCIAVTAAAIHTYDDGRPERLVSDTVYVNIKDRLLTCNPVHCCATMFRRSGLNKIQLPPDGVGHTWDLDLWLKLSELGTIERIPDIVVYYPRHAGTNETTTSKDPDRRALEMAETFKRARLRRGLPV